MKPLWITAILFLFVAACGEEKKPYEAPMPQTPTAPLFQSQQQALDKARSVEQPLDANAQEKVKNAEKD